MKTNYFSGLKLSIYSILGFLAFTATSCGSYQGSSTYDSDGIYGSSQNERNQNAPANNDSQSNGYKEYFGSLKNDDQAAIFTDVDNYNTAIDSTQNNNQTQEYSDGYSGWESSADNVTVNVYSSPNWGYGYWNDYWYGPGWNSWYGPSWGFGWNSWYGPSFGFGWGNYYGPYYGGYYPYYGNHYAYHGGRRGDSYTNGVRSGRSANNYSNGTRSYTQYNGTRRSSSFSGTRSNNGTRTYNSSGTRTYTSGTRTNTNSGTRTYSHPNNSTVRPSGSSSPTRSYTPSSNGGGRSSSGNYGGGGYSSGGSRGGGGRR
jgi:hypothetical protein